MFYVLILFAVSCLYNNKTKSSVLIIVNFLYSIFERVLPLPSENWSDFADFWFCHCHGDTPKPRPTCVWPKKGDCLVSNTYILVSASHVADGAVQEKKDNSILQCARCGNFLGVTMSNQNKENGGLVFDVLNKSFSASNFFFGAVYSSSL